MGVSGDREGQSQGCSQAESTGLGGSLATGGKEAEVRGLPNRGRASALILKDSDLIPKH